ncbi:MAG TPA: phenylpyruvate tautomerase MIF-related protein, partial [Verrucomicrobiae bacterium]|nr:phenylpyruvate tautomerase MIF-related protein [Verrucomicrobiae bacterium]
KQSVLLKAASKLLSEQLGKPEDYVMAAIEPPAQMIFAGSIAPTAFLSVKSIGLPDAKLKPLSAALCSLLKEHAGIVQDRVYIEFNNAQGKNWGFDGDTFG